MQLWLLQESLQAQGFYQRTLTLSLLNASLRSLLSSQKKKKKVEKKEDFSSSKCVVVVDLSVVFVEI